MSGGTTPSKPLSTVTPLRLFATLCVLVPTVAVIAVPTYNTATPKVGGFPFFYWYQLIWVVITGVLMVAAYWAIKVDEQRRKGHRAAGAGDAGAALGVPVGDAAAGAGQAGGLADGLATEGEAEA